MDHLFDNNRGFDSDVMCKIMLFLSADVACGMRAISKNWYRSVRDNGFIMYHNGNCNVRGQSSHILICEFDNAINSSRIFLSVSNRLLDVETWVKVVPHPDFTQNHKMHIIGIVNGIMCMSIGSFNYNCNYVVSNPVTGQHTTIKTTNDIGHAGNVHTYTIKICENYIIVY